MQNINENDEGMQGYENRRENRQVKGLKLKKELRSRRKAGNES